MSEKEHDAEIIEPTDEQLEGEATEPVELDPLEVLQQELGEANDKNLRLVAELRNVQQRAQREKEAALQFASGGLATELLPVLDDLTRTYESLQANEATQAAGEGIRIVLDQILKVFKAHEIEEIPAAGEPFDPEVHEAMMQQPSDDVPEGVVLTEVARGYRMKGRVLRSSKVIVSSGPA